jgi:uncharacterized protein (DUF2252 family)
MTMSHHVPHASVAERRALGKQARERAALEAHAEWQPPADRVDPISLLEAQDRSRDADLVPVRHGRMMVSPFTFYRGSAAIMAADLASTPTAGLDVQLCGDAHLSNFGAYASPERRLLFDLNDFDETLPGPFEYDVKRLAASFAIAARNNRFAAKDARLVTLAVVKAYRKAMIELSSSSTLDVWYARLSENEVRDEIERAARRSPARSKRSDEKSGATLAEAARRGKASLEKAHTRTSLQALAKLTEVVDGKQRIVSNPPVLVPLRELGSYYGLDADELAAIVDKQFGDYRLTLDDSRRRLLDRYTIVDVARKVVGVGSVGTRAFVALLQGRDERDPLFLQVKEATQSVLEAYLPKSRFTTSGERVVQGQRMIQSASDIFLGWSEGVEADRYYYWRQLRDMKGSADVDAMVPAGMNLYARFCGWTLARAHARSGDPIAIAAYLGGRDRFDTAIAQFAERYAVQNERDFRSFRDAISSGRLEARTGV